MSRFIDRTGEKYITNEGEEVIVIECFSANNITIRYSDGVIVKNIYASALKSGQIRKPVNRVGERWKTNEGDLAEIIEYIGSLNVTVRFNDGNTSKNLQYKNIVSGAVKNPYLKNICGVGYLGDVSEFPKDRKYTVLYTKWSNMLNRCYKESELIKFPSYRDVTVCAKWHCFANFYTWGSSKYLIEYMKKWQLDKDILFKGNKIYSPDTCCFVPSKINNLFIKSNSIRGEYPIGVYKKGNLYRAVMKMGGKTLDFGTYSTPEEAFKAYKVGKEQRIKEVAIEFKDTLDVKTYQAMINYQVEITD